LAPLVLKGEQRQLFLGMDDVLVHDLKKGVWALLYRRSRESGLLARVRFGQTSDEPLEELSRPFDLEMFNSKVTARLSSAPRFVRLRESLSQHPGERLSVTAVGYPARTGLAKNSGNL